MQEITIPDAFKEQLLLTGNKFNADIEIVVDQYQIIIRDKHTAKVYELIKIKKDYKPIKTTETRITYAKCKIEPKGIEGLETYYYNQFYKFEIDKNPNGSTFIKIYPNDQLEYFDICSPKIFTKYFMIEIL